MSPDVSADAGAADSTNVSEAGRPESRTEFDESHLSLSWLLGHPLVGAAALSSAGAGLVHAAAAGTHSAERVAALLFAVTGALQVAWAFYYLARPTRAAAVMGLVLNGSFAAMWLASRTIGLPFPEALAGVEHVTVQDTIAAMLGVAAAICAALAAWRPERVRQHQAGSIVVASVISVAVIVFTVGGVSATHGHGTAGADHSAMDMASMPAGTAGTEPMPGMDMGSMPGMDMGTGGQASGSAAESGTSPDLDFARSTVIRRAQVLRMAELTATNSTNSDVAALAFFITSSSPPEVDRMAAELRAANHDVPDLASVSTGSLAGPFAASLLTEADFAKLENAYGSTFDRVFLSLLERHHDGAITAAGLVLGTGTNPMARTTAREVLVSSATQLTTVSGLAEALHDDEPQTEIDGTTADEHAGEDPAEGHS